MTEARKCTNFMCRDYGLHVCRCYAADDPPQPSAPRADEQPNPYNPDLPKLLRAAADELDRWRLLEAAKVIGGKVIG